MTLNLQGQLMDLSTPRVMGILNVTPDSFFSGSRSQDADAVVARVSQMLAEGADIIDVGAYSTRPGGTEVTADEEMRRLDWALTALRKQFPQAVVSIDTFRADVARRCIADFGVQLINDITAGSDPDMYKEVSRARVPYIIMEGAAVGGPAVVPSSDRPQLIPDMLRFFAQRIQTLHDMGVADVVIDPGFGFGKTVADNHRLLHRLADFHILGAPILVGVSRKSMIWRPLGITPEQALNGTTVLNTIALMAGAHILRVHDVQAAVQAIRLVTYNSKAPLSQSQAPCGPPAGDARLSQR